ncbi:unnamed protein product [Ectocarpus sp. CCAP 1310/34]|nr:unnamed protein product [Ectocarpus sp. CCAP 1310/34]
MEVGGRRKPGSGWISSLEAVARESQGTEVDQGTALPEEFLMSPVAAADSTLSSLKVAVHLSFVF